jgi:drug/metabolite transporter (DMT)-like permease
VWSHLAVVAAALLFGSTFVVVKHAVADVAVVPFLGVRFLIGAAVLLPFVARTNRRGAVRPGVVGAGVAAGVPLLIGYLFQTAGLQYTTSSVSAFITYLLVVFVPILSAVVLRRFPTAPTLGGVAIATAGLFLLTGEGTHLGKGELLTLGCAVAFAINIVVLAHVAPLHDTLTLNFVQLLVVGSACFLAGMGMGGYAFPARVWVAAAFTGVFASALAFALQVYGQRRVGPTRTSLLLTIEPVAAAFVGYAAGDRLGWTGVAGALLILAGIAVAEIPLARRLT